MGLILVLCAVLTFLYFIFRYLLAELYYIFPYILTFSIVCIVLIIGTRILKIVFFYNRDYAIRKMQLNPYIKEGLTRKILERQHVKIGKSTADFEMMKMAYEEVLASSKKRHLSGEYMIDNASKNPFKKYNIECLLDPMILRFCKEKNVKDRSYVFYVFTKSILVFAEGRFYKAFIGAFNVDALKIEGFATPHMHSVVVYEKSRENIEYYYKYSPVSDATIALCEWTVKNLDGSRSFRGGLKPEHNPLNFVLLHAKLKFNIGKIDCEIEFSNHKAAKDFINSYKKCIYNAQNVN